MSSSLLPKHSFWLGKECLSREVQFVTVSLTLRYLPDRFFKTILHQLKPTALTCCERGKYSTSATLLPNLCDSPVSLSPTAKHLHPALCPPAGFPPFLICSSPGLSQVAAVFPQSRMISGRDQMLCCPFISPWVFPGVLFP